MESSQTIQSVKSFEWQWTEKSPKDSEKTLYRRLFKDLEVWHDFYDGKTVADVGSGTGRHVWAYARLTKAKKIISVELAPKCVEKQKRYIKDPRVELIQGDMGLVKFKADVILAGGVIQHTQDPLAVMKNLVDNLNDGGELFISFYLKTFATTVLRPLRAVLSKLPPKALWAISPLLAPIFMVHADGREAGFGNAVISAYDWFGSHEYQYYFTPSQIHRYLLECGIHPSNILHHPRGYWRVRKGAFPLALNEELLNF